MLTWCQQIKAMNNSTMLVDTLSGQLEIYTPGTVVFITEIWPSKGDYIA